MAHTNSHTGYGRAQTNNAPPKQLTRRHTAPLAIQLVARAAHSSTPNPATMLQSLCSVARYDFFLVMLRDRFVRWHAAQHNHVDVEGTDA